MRSSMHVRKLIVLLLACLGGAALSAQSTKERAQPPAACDVLVYGATPGGVCAAIGAAREGASVVLLEPTEHIGGLSTGGLSHCDSNQMDRTTVMGLFDEWHRRIVADYAARGRPAPYDPTKKDQARWTFEPHVAMRVTRASARRRSWVLSVPGSFNKRERERKRGMLGSKTKATRATPPLRNSEGANQK